MLRLLSLVAAVAAALSLIACGDTIYIIQDPDAGDTAGADATGDAAGDTADEQPVPTLRELGIYTPDDPEWEELGFGMPFLEYDPDFEGVRVAGGAAMPNGWAWPGLWEVAGSDQYYFVLEQAIMRESDAEIWLCGDTLAATISVRALAAGGIGCMQLDEPWSECGCTDDGEWFAACAYGGLGTMYHRSAFTAEYGHECVNE